MSKSRRPKIGLALGSGSARGLAHIGVLKMLEKNQVPIDLISGSSIGALIGGIYAATGTFKKLERIAKGITKRKLLFLIDPLLKAPGLLKGKKVEKVIDSWVEGKKFKDLKIPFVAVATDLKTGQEVLLKSGKVSTAIRASISIPGIFNPVKIGNNWLIDGGVVSPIPASVVKQMGADIVIAVNLNARFSYDPINRLKQGITSSTSKEKLSLVDIVTQTIDIMEYKIIQSNLKEADVVITPKVNDISWAEYYNASKIIKLGEQATLKIIPKLKKIPWLKKIMETKTPKSLTEYILDFLEL